MLTEEQIEQLGVTHESYGYRGGGHAPPTHTFYPKDLIEFTRAIEQAVRQEMAADREAAFKAGWVRAADWGNRTDLWADIDSPQYLKEMSDELAAIDQARKAP